MESMEMFTEILKDFKQSDLESLKVEMPGIRLSMKRQSDPQNTASASRNTVTTNSRDNAVFNRNSDTDSGTSGFRRTGAGSPDSAGSADSSDAAVSADTSAAGSANAAGRPAEAPEKDASSESETIQCPLVGVFYSASSPGAEPFVREGQEVHKGDVLCIIEAMKSMNELKAPYNLKIRKVCVENGEMAEFHQVLFEVEKC